MINWASVKLPERPPVGDMVIVHMSKFGKADTVNHPYFAQWTGKHWAFWDDEEEKDVDNNPDYWVVTHWSYVNSPYEEEK